MIFHRDEPSETEFVDPGAPRTSVSRVRTMLVHGWLVAIALAIIAKAAQLQIVEGDRWARLAAEQQIREEQVTPPRGRIFDANGDVLAETRELIRARFTPSNIRPYRPRGKQAAATVVDTRVVVRHTLKSLGVNDQWIKKVLDTTRKWVELPMEFLPGDLERLKGLPGYNPERVHRRRVAATSGIVGIVGAVDGDGKPISGLELELDAMLRGVGGTDVRVKDGLGDRLETPAFSSIEARPGHDITLTINQSLQEIAEHALAEGVKGTGASGGDVVIMDPRDGAVLAMSAIRNGKVSVTATALSEPFEPGSVMKPFIVARALELGRVHADEMINTEGGKWLNAGAVITDDHKADVMSVFDVIRLSSNIGVAKIAGKLSEREEYEAFRDFGFGTATGVPYPAESRGRLPVPKWHPQLAASMARGYGISATALQVAAAYVALANDGELLQPVLVREIREASGHVVYTHERRVVRQVIPAERAKEMRAMLASVVDSGTAIAANLSTYDVAGKSGTARRLVNGRYNQVDYNSSFAGMFPAQAPQFVLVVRLIDPKGKIFGGTVAGRVVNGILQNAIATRDGSLDRRALASLEKPLPTPAARPLTAARVASAMRDTARFDSLRAPAPLPAAAVAAPARVIVTLPLKIAKSASASDESNGVRTGSALRPVPSVYGLTAREATLTLHAAGFRVTTVAGGAGRTRPGAGTLARPGTVVVLETPQ